MADPPPRAAGGALVTGTFASTHRGTTVPYVLAYPPGHNPDHRLPVCLVLHGYTSDEHDLFDGMLLHRYLADAVAGGTRAYALAACFGGQRYWHRRADRDDPMRMVFEEFLPLLADRGLATAPADRLGVLGYSMGGYGALLFGQTQPERFAGVVAVSPAIWRSYDEARQVNPTAFDGEEDWKAHDVLAGWARTPPAGTAHLARAALRVDCGRSDPFAPAVEAFRDRLPDPSVVRFAEGCHDDHYWRSLAPAHLAFLGRALSRQ